MRMITGALLLLVSEQAFAHSQSIPFPNQIFANQVLYPTSMVMAGIGVIFIIWGLLCDTRSPEED